jgi:hypothetical protein
MDRTPDEKLDRLLKEAYPALEVSPDFTLKLWRRLMKEPARPPWMLPVPVLGLAAAVGMLAGIGTWVAGLGSASSPLNQVARWDLFGNAPVDSLAGVTLTLLEERKI